jgi:hypothetical protein
VLCAACPCDDDTGTGTDPAPGPACAGCTDTGRLPTASTVTLSGLTPMAGFYSLNGSFPLTVAGGGLGTFLEYFNNSLHNSFGFRVSLLVQVSCGGPAFFGTGTGFSVQVTARIFDATTGVENVASRQIYDGSYSPGACDPPSESTSTTGGMQLNSSGVAHGTAQADWTL